MQGNGSDVLLTDLVTEGGPWRDNECPLHPDLYRSPPGRQGAVATRPPLVGNARKPRELHGRMTGEVDGRSAGQTVVRNKVSE